MSRICDRSPCDYLLAALGKWIFFSKQEGFFATVLEGGEESDKSMEYCPSCGTRLTEVGPMMIEKFMRPRRRRKTANIKTAES